MDWSTSPNMLSFETLIVSIWLEQNTGKKVPFMSRFVGDFFGVTG